MEIVLQACHAWNILIGLQSLLYTVLLGLDKGNIYPHWVTGNLILKYNLNDLSVRLVPWITPELICFRILKLAL